MTMVCTPDIDTEIDAHFSCMEELEFPEIHLPFPPKTLKEQKWEQEMERVRRIKEHEKRFEDDSREISGFVNDCEFLGSEDSDASMDSGVSSSNIFRDDLESFNVQNNNDDQQNFQATKPHTSDLKYTCFDLLHCSRLKVKWSSEVYKKFQDASDLLNESLKCRAIPRIRNAPKRIANAERVRLTQGRYTQEQIRKRNESAPLSKFVDLFGYFRLLPQALSPEETENDKIQETAFKKGQRVVYKKPETDDEVEFSRIKRKSKVCRRFHLQMSDFDYSIKCHRQLNVEQEYLELAEKIAELENDLTNEESLQEEYEKNKEAEAESETSTSNVIFISNQDNNNTADKIEEPSLTMSSEEQPIRIKEQEKKEEEEEIVVAAAVSKERETCKMQRNYIEEMDRAAREVEEQRAHEELVKRQRAADEAAKAEADRVIEAHQRFIKAIDERRRAEEDRRKVAELEELRKGISEKMKHVEMETDVGAKADELASSVENVVEVTPPITLADNWLLRKVKKSAKQKALRKKYFSHYDYDADEGRRLLEHENFAETIRQRVEVRKQPLVVPQENLRSTRCKALNWPSEKRISISESAAAPAPLPLNTLVKQASDSLRRMMSKRKHCTVLVSLKNKEVLYKSITLQDLQKTFRYPFGASDGMYWPVFFALPDNHVEEHVAALTKCNSFSGKYASHFLLTASTDEEEGVEKKYDDAYQDSEGFWEEYCQKPGRFSKRKGFQPENTKCTDSFEVQKNRAIDANRNAFEREKKAMDEFGRLKREFEENHNKAEYDQQMQIHLSELVRDARLDVYSLKENPEFTGIIGHPGTRDSPLDPRWHNHGYYHFFDNRDREYIDFMNAKCRDYEDFLPPAGERDEFDEWCFTPMLASLYYQVSHSPFQVFSNEETRVLEQRRARYLAMLKSKRFSLKEAIEVCRLRDSDREQWTFLFDQLVSHFRDLPATFSLMYLKSIPLLGSVHQAVEDVMGSMLPEVSNRWSF